MCATVADSIGALTANTQELLKTASSGKGQGGSGASSSKDHREKIALVPPRYDAKLPLHLYEVDLKRWGDTTTLPTEAWCEAILRDMPLPEKLQFSEVQIGDFVGQLAMEMVLNKFRVSKGVQEEDEATKANILKEKGLDEEKGKPEVQVFSNS